MKTVRFRDPLGAKEDDRAVLLELRGGGAQTLVPPSVYPDGEACVWPDDGDPTEVDASDLVGAASRLAAAVLLASHWPAVGSRQDAALALSGGLLRAGWSEEETTDFVLAVAEASGDEEAAQRAATVTSTSAALSAGRNATGWPALALLVDTRIVDKAREWLGIRKSQEQTGTAPHSGARDDDVDTDASAERRAPSQATLLVTLARSAGVDLFHDGSSEPFATLERDGHRETWQLKTKSFRQFLARLFYEAHGKAAGSQAVQDALQVLGGEAQFGASEREVAVRLAGRDGALYLDLGDPEWRVVRIQASGWDLIAHEEAPVRFRRPRGMLPLPDPVRGGSVSLLRGLLNLASDDDFVLVVGFLLGCLYPDGPRAILQLLGEQGSAKSTQARLLRGVIDPNAVPLRTQPREEGDLLIAATNGAVVALDNLSELRPWLSDALCRLATGGGLSKRELYTDLDEVLLDARRPVLLTAIAEVATASDLLDRCVTVTLPAIPGDGRRTEAEIGAAFARARPAILGGLLDAAVTGLRNLPTTRLERRPRLADFATWVEAAAPALDWEPGTFLDAMEANSRAADAVAIEALPVGPALLAFMAERDQWEGSPTELLGLLGALVGEEARRSREWPKRANGLSNHVRRLMPNLRRVGLWVGSDRRPGSGQRLVLLTKNPDLWGRHHEEGLSQGAEGSSRDRHTLSEKSPPFRANSDGRDDCDDGDDVSSSPFQTGLDHEVDGSESQEEADYEEFVL